jgi:hypothetical protein
MKNNIAIVIAHLEQIISGEPAPAFQSPEFREILSNLTQLSSAEPFHQAVFESLGRRTVLLLLDRLSASMNAEREIAILRDNSKPIC